MPLTPPTNTTPPSITGASTNIGQTVTGDRGVWAGAPHTYRYRWYYRNAAGTDRTLLYQGVFTAQTTTLVIPRSAALAGWFIELEVVAENIDGARKLSSANFGPITNPGGVAITTFLPVAEHPVQIKLCALSGVVISDLTGISVDRDYEFDLGLARMIAFRVPARDPLVFANHTDGIKKLRELHRVIKVLIHERNSDGTWTWDPLFAGVVRHVEPAGTSDGVAWVKVIAYDPRKRFEDVYVRTSAGSATGVVSFSNTRGDQIAKTLVDRAQATSGSIGIDTAGTYEVCPLRSASFQQQTLDEALSPIEEAWDGFDLWLEPKDRIDGILAQMDVYVKRSRDVSDQTIFAWGVSPFTATDMNNPAGDDPANDVTAAGSKASIYGQYSDAAAKTAIGPYEKVDEYSDISDVGTLTGLARARVESAKKGVKRVVVAPAPGIAGIDYRNMWHVGDIAKARGALLDDIDEKVRLYGLKATIDDNNIFRITELLAHPEETAIPAQAFVRHNTPAKVISKLKRAIGRLRRSSTQTTGQTIEYPFSSLPAGTYSIFIEDAQTWTDVTGKVNDVGGAVAMGISYQKNGVAVNGPDAAVSADLPLVAGDTVKFTTTLKATFNIIGRLDG